MGAKDDDFECGGKTCYFSAMLNRFDDESKCTGSGKEERVWGVPGYCDGGDMIVCMENGLEWRKYETNDCTGDFENVVYEFCFRIHTIHVPFF